MTPDLFLTSTLVPGLSWLAETVGLIPANSREARLMCLVIPGQESGWQNIAQANGGPARGPYQMESPTCELIAQNAASKPFAIKVCAALGIDFAGNVVWNALIGNPRLAVAFARLDLYCDRHALPAYGNVQAAWNCYVRVWGPGAVAAGGTSAAEARQRWTVNYTAALLADQAREAAQGVKT